jgi:methionine-rich copper-binding protein CopC
LPLGVAICSLTVAEVHDMPRHRFASALVAVLAGLACGVHAHAQLVDPEVADGGLNPFALDNPPMLLDTEHTGCGKACRARLLAEQGWQPGMLLPGMRSERELRGPGTTDPTDVLNNTLSIEVNPPNRPISGSNTMTIRSNVNNLTSFTFRLRSNMTVNTGGTANGVFVTDSLGSYTAIASTPPTNNTSYGRTITFARPISAGQTFTIRIDYSGSPANLSFGSFYAGPQNGTTGAPGAICTLSEPYYAGTWWPCKDGDVLQAGDNSDKATLTISITSPDTFRSTANGLLVGTSVPSAGKITYTYATSYPMTTYLVSFSTSQYTNFTDTYVYPGGTMPLDFNIYPSSDTTSNRNAWRSVKSMLAAFRGVYGEYPFISEKYGIYQFEFSGGQEHQTNTGQGRGATFDEGVTAHELGHQWWGDNVTCKTFADIWLNEGFATYSEALWAERKPGSTGLAALRTAMNSRKPATFTESVYCTDVANVNRIFSTDASYRKGGWVLHQLRHVVGDSTFFAILAAYRNTYQGSAAATADFTSIASQVAGQNLDWFFNPWVFGIGAPSYAYGWENATIDGQKYVRLSIEQTQQASNPTWPLFPMPIDVRVNTASSSPIVVVENDAVKTYHLIPLSESAVSIVLDGSDWILNRAKDAVAYEPGPAKVVSISPAPGAALATAPSSVRIAFSDNVNVTAGAIGVSRVVGTATSSVPFTLSYDPQTFVATLSFASSLSAGTYNIAIADSVYNVAAGSTNGALDGELSSNSIAALPSGNGRAGGSLAFSFSVNTPPCVADFNQDGSRTIDDVFIYINAWFANDPRADINNDGTRTIDDIFVFINLWFAGC